MARKITPTHVLLNQIELSSSASSVTFSNIPQGYGDLVLVFQGTSTSSVNGNLYFNADTTSGNYFFVRMYGQGSGSGNSNTGNDIPYDFYTNDTIVKIQIMDYSATDKHKTAVSRWDTPANITGATAYRWANTAAIASILIDPGAASFTAGSIFSLYGVYA